jgi:hypothetical protein
MVQDCVPPHTIDRFRVRMPVHARQYAGKHFSRKPIFSG